MGNITWGPRGYPGNQGLKGKPGQKGDTGDTGQGATVTNNGDGTVTITGSNGSVIVRDGKTPIAGVDYFPGSSGDYLSIVYAHVETGEPPPSITNGTGTYDGTNETMPTGSTTWSKVPPYQEGYTVYVSFNRYIHDPTTGGSGSWELLSPVWSAPTVYQINPIIVNKFTSYVFKRDSSTPNKPIGGSYSSPIPSGWFDGVPTGSLPVYISKRLFTDTGGAPQDTEWSEPAILGSSGSSSKFKFMGDPPTLVASDWDDIPEATDEWMVTCIQDANGTWTCDYANPVKIKGETGAEAQSKYLASAFKRSNNDLTTILPGGFPEVPEGGDFDNPYPQDTAQVTGWTKNIPPGTANLYVSNRMFTSDGLAPQEANWSGAELFSGSNASNFVLTSDSQVFAFDEEGNITPNEINLSVNKQHIGNDTTWAIVDSAGNPVTVADNTGPKDTLTIIANEFNTADTGFIKVTATAGAFTDTVTIAKVVNGSAALTGLLTNEVDSVFADVAGVPTFNGDEGGEFLVYLGATNVVTDCTFAVNGTSSETKPSGLRLDINQNTGVYTLSESPNWTSDKETFELVATYVPTNSTVTKKYTLTKSKEGAVGAQGTSTRIDIAYGTTSSGGSVNYPSLSWPFNTRTYTTATSSGKTFMGTNAVTWEPNDTAPEYGEPLVSNTASDYEWTEIVGSDGTNGLSSRLDIAYGDNADGTGNTQFPSNSSTPTPATPVPSNKYIGTNVETWDSSTTPPNARQNVSFYEWSKMTGTDALNVVLTNSSHAVPCDNAGTVTSYDNSGTTISVREGANKLSHDNVGTSNGTWKVTSVVAIGGITAGIGVDSVDDKVYGTISGWASGTGNLSAKLIFTVEGTTNDGTSFSGLVAEQTFSKNIGGGGSSGSQINTALIGTIHGSSVTVNHPSQNNSMTVNWNASVSSSEVQDGATAGDNPPSGTITVNLKKNGVTVDSQTLTLESSNEPGNNFWIISCPLQTHIESASGTGNVEWKIEWSGNTSFDPIYTNDGYISITETL